MSNMYNSKVMMLSIVIIYENTGGIKNGYTSVCRGSRRRAQSGGC